MKRTSGHVFFPVHAGFEKAYKAPRSVIRRKLHDAALTCSPGNEAMRRALMDIARVHVLEAELLQYRCLLDKMVGQRCAQLNRRIAILKSCNEKLSAELIRARAVHADLLCQRIDVERRAVVIGQQLAG